MSMYSDRSIAYLCTFLQVLQIASGEPPCRFYEITANFSCGRLVESDSQVNKVGSEAARTSGAGLEANGLCRRHLISYSRAIL